MPELPSQERPQFVLDGGAILHLIPWQRGVPFALVLKTYADYITGTYGQPVVVFDGYQESS